MDKALFLFGLREKFRIKFLLEGLDSVGPAYARGQGGKNHGRFLGNSDTRVVFVSY